MAVSASRTARSSSRCPHIWFRTTCTASTCRASMHRVAGLLIVTTVFAVQVAAQDTTSFDRHEAMVPMRDGVKLHTSWYVPRNITGPLPIIFSRTPYGIEHADGAFRSYYQALVKEGYLFAFQDIRGRFGSEGTFGMQRKPDHRQTQDRKSTRLNSSHSQISYAVFCLKKKKTDNTSRLVRTGLSLSTT